MSNSLVEPYALSSWAKGEGITHCFIYHGPSMIPTFNNGDFLYLRSRVQKLHRGDIVVFTNPDLTEYIVHRIVSSSNRYFITHGDHNRLSDVSPVILEQILGKVELVYTNHGIRRVANGVLGLWMAMIWQLVFSLDRVMRRLFWIPYEHIRLNRLVTIFWKPKISKLQIQLESSQQIKYLYKNRTVAVWHPSRQRFDCKKPFDLVISPPEKSK